ncbi:MAG: hypothetical protein ACRYGL_08205 [Janthinobacterium lividum]
MTGYSSDTIFATSSQSTPLFRYSARAHIAQAQAGVRERQTVDDDAVVIQGPALDRTQPVATARQSSRARRQPTPAFWTIMERQSPRVAARVAVRRATCP